MIEQSSLADVIQRKLVLGPENARGFRAIACKVCNDYQDRGGFKFDGDTTGYSCWNCKAAFKYEEGTGRLSRNAKQVLEAFGITKEDLVSIRSALLNPAKEEAAEVSLEDLKKVKLHTPEVALPDRSHVLGCAGFDEFQEPLIEYLLSRKIDPLGIRAHFSLDPRFLRRVIIPFYRDGKVIYWQARTIDDIKPRYLNSAASRDAVMYGYDLLYSYDPAPLFVTEGVFDAISLNGVCILGSSLNTAKIEVLKRCRRRVIFVIDRDKTGGELGKTVRENGWEFSFVDKRASDANKSVQLFGLPYTIYSLMKNVTREPALLGLGVLEGSLGAYR